MYQSLPIEVPISQGDIMDDCPLLTLEAAPGQTAQPTSWRTRVVVLTQACDVAQAKTTRILVAVLHSAADVVARGVLKTALVRDQIRRGLVFGWYFLPIAPPPLVLPESLVDLRELHTVSRLMLEQLVALNL